MTNYILEEFFDYGFTEALSENVVCDYWVIFHLYKEQKQLQTILDLAEVEKRKRIIVYNQFC